MDLPRWTEIILLLLAIVAVIGVVAAVVTEVFMRKGRLSRLRRHFFRS
jgi:uncharacterized membrane protein